MAADLQLSDAVMMRVGVRKARGGAGVAAWVGPTLREGMRSLNECFVLIGNTVNQKRKLVL